jgi:hypothetical protein
MLKNSALIPPQALVEPNRAIEMAISRYAEIARKKRSGFNSIKFNMIASI